MEILNIINETGFIPDLICTNNPAYHETELYQTLRTKTKFRFAGKWKCETYMNTIFDSDVTYTSTTTPDPVITLHGWLRIIPADVCNTGIEIYNGHPALVNHYPELKGKDQQEKVINQLEKYPLIGSIVHEVIPEVDAGKLYGSIEVPNILVHNKEVIYQILKDTSLRCWLKFLPTIL